MKIKFYGVRGSTQTPSRPDFKTETYGGNTTCIAVESEDQLYIVDSGSGIKVLGDDLLSKPNSLERGATILYTHFHPDHFWGFPFFAPVHIPGNNFQVVGLGPRRQNGTSNKTIGRFGYLLDPRFFPVQISKFGAELSFMDTPPIGKVDDIVEAHAFRHPGGVLSYRFKEGDRSLVITTDAEFKTQEDERKIRSWIAGTDIWIVDAQYTKQEYFGEVGFATQGFGHPYTDQVLRIAEQGGVKEVYITHHDPKRDDTAMLLLEERTKQDARRLLRDRGRLEDDMKVSFAREGLELKL